MRNIYILNCCDEWKSCISMSLVAATTSLRKLKSIIIQKVKDGDIEYKRGEDNLSKTQQIKMLRQDWKNEGEGFVFDCLSYGDVEIVEDGEIQ